ncbi:helix-turn-helix transcriptional regulator [Vermiculatibacterium agrestimuris]|uniref:helix-turn-helix transcriptional regulator n=1 Tax=Vermiculatibacterium agrestimuris TaxID=2941519 RepID=UPI002040B1EE|nr:WYL domain-containing transcriptional regulator [Vermiculatibacterium agrestimuris]
MSKKGGQKAKLLRICQLLLERTDEEHPLSTQELIRLLAAEEISAERKSIYADMELLQELGVDVQQSKGKGWFIGAREFELPELKLLVDAVQSSRFISRRKSDALIRKLESLTSKHQAKQLRRQVYVDRRVKTDNEGVYYAIDKLHAAIAANRTVTFQYFDYNVKREKVFRREGKRYAVSPYGLIWADENYYLVGREEGGEELRHYRVDKMAALTVTSLPRREDGRLRDFDLAEYGQRHFHMFSGRQAQVRLRCPDRMVNIMLDRFGQEAMLIPDGEGHFALTVDAVVSPQFYGWLFGLGDGVELTAPAWAVEEYREMLRRALGEK